MFLGGSTAYTYPRLQICPLYIFGNKQTKPQMVPSRIQILVKPGFCFDTGPNVQPWRWALTYYWWGPTLWKMMNNYGETWWRKWWWWQKMYADKTSFWWRIMRHCKVWCSKWLDPIFLFPFPPTKHWLRAGNDLQRLTSALLKSSGFEFWQESQEVSWSKDTKLKRPGWLLNWDEHFSKCFHHHHHHHDHHHHHHHHHHHPHHRHHPHMSWMWLDVNDFVILWCCFPCFPGDLISGNLFESTRQHCKAEVLLISIEELKRPISAMMPDVDTSDCVFERPKKCSYFRLEEKHIWTAASFR